MAAALRPDAVPRYVRLLVLERRAAGGYALPDIRCPRHHPVRAAANVTMLEGAALFECSYRDGSARAHSHHQPCGLTLLVLAGCRTPLGTPAFYVAHVTPGELARLERDGLTVDEMLRHLNET